MDQRTPKEPQDQDRRSNQNFLNNQSAISVAHNPMRNDQMKHVNIDWHWIRVALEDCKINTPYTGSFKQRADVLTKESSKDQFMKPISKLGLIDIQSSALKKGGGGELEGHFSHLPVNVFLNRSTY